MNQSDLSFEQAPPISVPLRFFLSAPLFAVLAALMLAWNGPTMLASRWNMQLLATTHLITLGFIGLAMLGALMQMLPVVAGTPVKRPASIAGIVHLMMLSGIALLATGLALPLPALLSPAIVLLGGGLLTFIVTVLLSLRKALPGNVTVIAMRCAVFSLAAAATLGLLLASNHAWGWWLTSRHLFTNMHLAWGIFGWIGLLVTGVAFRVVPMFQLTPQYPSRITRWLVPLLFVLLLAWSLASTVLSQLPGALTLIGGLLAAAFCIFAMVTLRLQHQRRRKLPDVTLSFWQIAMYSILATAALWLAAQLYPPLRASEQYDLALGILMLVGGAMSAINGMLYKIVPFLVWFHLQRLKLGWRNVPNVREILPEQRTRPQLWLHFAAVLLLLASAAGMKLLIYPAALALAVSSAWLWLNLLAAYRIYRRLSYGKTPPAGNTETTPRTTA